jgi:putative sigma-54 modulation protein
MQLTVKGRNIDVTDRITEYADKRLGKLLKQLPDDVTKVELELSEEKNPRVADSHVAEATIWTKGPTIRAKEASHDLFASIDLVAEKLARQVRKNRDRVSRGAPSKDLWRGALRENGNGSGELPNGYEFNHQLPTEGSMDTDTAINIVKTKQFQSGPMTPEEAAQQLELLGHEFFLFQNADSGDTCVLYRRADGDYGLVEPTIARAEAS